MMRALATEGARHVPPAPDDLLLSLDDTDNLDSPGTGYRARELGLLLAQAGLGRPMAITRHQLLVDPRIPYTSHNSSACIVLIGATQPAAVFDLACRYLRESAASGSDVGTVLLRRADVPAPVLAWGQRAKREVLDLPGARALAQAIGCLHAELSGTGGGLIGALAAVGLNCAGNDGRFLWLRGIRELAGHNLPAQEVVERLGVDLQTLDGQHVNGPQDRIDLGDWPRAIYRGHHAVLLVEKDHESSEPLWRCVDRDTVKRLSS